MTGMPPPLDALAALAEEVGLELRGTLAAEPLPDTDPALPARLDAWLAAGYQGDMTYLERAVELGPDLRRWKDWTRGALLFALPYHRPAGGFRGGGRVARYALGRDYHQVIGKKLERLGRRLRAHGLATRYRATVDAAPVLEREWALRAGLGWRGKNTLFLHPEHGPWMLL
ncbi:MAG: epoxyqueuosine reductase, partial [Planctomycetota bacterium]